MLYSLLRQKSSISGNIGYDPDDKSTGALRIFYGTELKLYDMETGEQVDYPHSYYQPIYQYNGKTLIPIGKDKDYLFIDNTDYDSGPYEIEPVTDAQQVRTIYLRPYEDLGISTDYLVIPRGSTGVVDVGLGAYNSFADYAIILSADENIATVNPERLDRSGQITITAVNSGFTAIEVFYEGGHSNNMMELIWVTVPYDCEIDAVNKPSVAVIDGDHIRATVPHSATEQEIDITVGNACFSYGDGLIHCSSCGNPRKLPGRHRRHHSDSCIGPGSC